MTPTRIGRYELQAEIGRGGFGRVYRALDALMSRLVAVKVLNSECDADLLARFRVEARTLAKLDHENIVTVYDFGDHEGAPYIVMELLDGRNLGEALVSGAPLSLIDKLRIMTEMAAGLKHAHEEEVIHRDVKPANVMVMTSGGIKIMDFGIAQVIEAGVARRTRIGDLVGTTIYMAPEQFKGASADSQTDIYSFGTVCYEMFLGRHPFFDDDRTRTMARIAREDPPPLHSLITSFPPALSDIVQRCLSKDREIRYQSFEDLIPDIDPILADLKCREAEVLLARAKRCMEKGEVENTRKLLRTVLELDPINAEARRLRSQIQTLEMRQVKLRRIAALLQRADEQMRTRDYRPAADSFEECLQLDPECQEALRGLEKARSLLESSRLRSRMLAQAKEGAAAGNLSAAVELAKQALDIDRTNPEAAQFYDELRIRMALTESRRYREQKQFDAADQALEALRLDQNLQIGTSSLHHEVEAEREEILKARRTDQEERRRADIATYLSRIEDECARGDFEAALVSANDGARKFEEAGDQFTDLTFRIREEKAASRRASIVQRALSEAATFVASQTYPEAICVLQTAIVQYPREKLLLDRLQEVQAAKKAYARREDIMRALSNTRSRFEDGDLDGAKACLESAAKRYPDVADFEEWRITITAQIAERALASEWSKLRLEAEDLLPSDPEAVVALLESGNTQYSVRPGYLELLEKARLRADLVSRVAAIRSAMARQEWRIAGANLEATEQVHGDCEELEQLAKTIANAQKVDRLRDSLNNARRLLESGETQAARDMYLSIEPHPEIAEEHKRVGLEFTRRHDYESDLAVAESYRKAGLSAKAESLLRHWTSRNPPDGKASMLLKVLMSEQLAKAAGEALKQREEKIQRLIAEGSHREAEAAVLQLMKQYPENPKYSGYMLDLQKRLPSIRATCPGCVSPVPSNSKFCDECGKPIQQAARSNAQQAEFTSLEANNDLDLFSRE